MIYDSDYDKEFYKHKSNRITKNRKKMGRKKRSKRKKRKKMFLEWLNKDTILPFLKMPQDRAAQILNVSISTLKRKFYELRMMGRWPTNRRTPSEKCRKKKLNYLIHIKNVEDEKKIDEETWKFLIKVVGFSPPPPPHLCQFSSSS